MPAPFDNQYTLRLVAPSQSKACMICYKPSDHVLITSNNSDFFYICYHHLLDDHFATHTSDEKYDSLVKEQKALTLLVEELTGQAEKAKPSFFSNVPGFKSKPSENKEPQNNYEQLTKNKQENEKKLEELNEQIKQFKFKQYKLNGDIYNMRIKSYIGKKVNEKRLKDMNNPGFFPSTPTNNPGTPNPTDSDSGPVNPPDS